MDGNLYCFLQQISKILDKKKLTYVTDSDLSFTDDSECLSKVYQIVSVAPSLLK